MAGGHIVELVGVRKAFGDQLVLNAIDLRISRGEAIVIAGPSGSGKSTMLRCINGLETIDAGSITFDGHRIDAAGRG
jgi:ABC-type Fe3+/spermidine/putrescine transport system ATPase subunit